MKKSKSLFVSFILAFIIMYGWLHLIGLYNEIEHYVVNNILEAVLTASIVFTLFILMIIKTEFSE